jgi:hypothetical protein
MKENVMGGACGTQTKFWLEDLGVVEKIILERILGKQGGKV